MGKKIMVTNTENLVEEKPYSRFQWFLFAIVPIFFTILIVLIIMTIAGVNIFQYAKDVGSKIPVVSSMIQDEAPTVENQQKIVDFEAEIKDVNAKMIELENSVSTKDQEIQSLDTERQRLLQEIEALKIVQEENKSAFKDIIRTYEAMTPKKAARIITALEEAEAIKILSNLKADTRSAILEKMDPTDAAKLMQQLSEKSISSAS